MTAQFKFVMRSEPNPGTEFLLEDPEIMIGRESTCSLVINDAEVSRKHARVIWQASNYVIEDVGSTNGTFINGKRLTSPFVLQGGEIITLGENIVLVFESALDPDATRMSTALKSVPSEKAEVLPVQEPEKPAPLAPTPAVVPEATEEEPVLMEPNWKGRIRKIDRRLAILLVVGVILLCGCGLLAVYLFNAPPSFWCKVLPFIFNPQNYNCVP
jgi:predicted component of type VI protein secretion system